MTSGPIHKPLTAIVLFVSISLLMTGCGQLIKDETKKELAKDVECESAEQDIAILEEQRASTMRQVGIGVQFVVPIPVAINIFRSYNQDGTSEEFYNDREQVVTGEYNKSIDAKIQEIQRICDLPGK